MSPAPIGLLNERREIDVNGQVVSLLAPDIDDLLAQGEAPYDWVIPGLIEAADRTLLTGGEGEGKSTLCRQIAMTAASGIHPFTLAPIDPVNVLLLEFENSQRQTIRKFQDLRATAGGGYSRGRLRVRVATGGVDLTRSDEADQFVDLVGANRPDLLIAGPIYKMADGDPSDEQTARAVAQVFDRVRAEFGPAILLEAHSPHASGGSSRPLRPFGASLWRRWPEFGIHLSKEGKVTHWRGPRDEREWPERLQRGEPWPWMPDDGSSASDDFRPTVLMGRVSRRLVFLEASGQHPTKTALVASTTGKKQYLHHAVDALIVEGYIATDGKTLSTVRPFEDGTE
jgi:hypothetical protein